MLDDADQLTKLLEDLPAAAEPGQPGLPGVNPVPAGGLPGPARADRPAAAAPASLGSGTAAPASADSLGRGGGA